jgi:hypothetical protein
MVDRGFPDNCFHSSRCSARLGVSSRAMGIGPPKEAGKTLSLLGHSDLGTTLNTYSHVIPASQRRAVERVSEVLFSSVLKLGENVEDGKIN